MSGGELNGADVLSLPMGMRRKGSKAKPTTLRWLRALPDVVTRESLVRWRASHTSNWDHSVYAAAFTVVRTALAADDVAEAARAAWAEQSALLAVPVKPVKKAKR